MTVYVLWVRDWFNFFVGIYDSHEKAEDAQLEYMIEFNDEREENYKIEPMEVNTTVWP